MGLFFHVVHAPEYIENVTRVENEQERTHSSFPKRQVTSLLEGYNNSNNNKNKTKRRQAEVGLF